MKMTLLFRKGGMWQLKEISRLAQMLNTQVSGHRSDPEYILLLGHFTKEETLAVIRGGVAFTATQVEGLDSGKLPFVPDFAQP